MTASNPSATTTCKKTKAGADAKLEVAIQREILRWLKRRPDSFTANIHGGPYQQAGLPDIYHLEQGITFWFEVKRPGMKYGVTKLQRATMNKLVKAGRSNVLAVAVTSLAEVESVVSGMLKEELT